MKMPGISTAFAAVATSLLVTTTALAEDSSSNREAASSAKENRVVARAESSVQVNPAVLRVGGGASYRHGDRHYVEGGAGLAASNYYVAPGAHAEVKPLDSLTLRLDYAFLAYAGHDEGGATHQISLSNRWEHRFGPMVLRSGASVSYLHSNGQSGPTYYLPDQDTRVKSNDVLITSRFGVLFAVWENGKLEDGAAQLLVGPSLQSQWALRSGLSRQRVAASTAFATGKMAVGFDAGVDASDANHQGELFAQIVFGMEF